MIPEKSIIIFILIPLMVKVVLSFIPSFLICLFVLSVFFSKFPLSLAFNYLNMVYLNVPFWYLFYSVFWAFWIFDSFSVIHFRSFKAIINSNISFCFCFLHYCSSEEYITYFELDCHSWIFLLLFEFQFVKYLSAYIQIQLFFLISFINWWAHQRHSSVSVTI